MSSSSSQIALPSNTTATGQGAAVGEISRLKRQLAVLQEELDELNLGKIKKPQTPVALGRGVRRLVTLYDSLEDLVHEADQHFREGNDADESVSDDSDEESQRSSRLKIRAYTTLLQVLPGVKTMIQDPSSSNIELNAYLALTQKGANDARSDDVRCIKEELATWLNIAFTPTPPMTVKSRNDRGLQNAITGRLLFPIEYKWEDERIRNQILAGELDISSDFFLWCFYPHGNSNPNNVEKGFLCSKLLVKTYSAIFTSPSSSEAFDTEDENGPARKQQRTLSQKKATKSNVATLLHMEGKVTPRSIAYAAVLLAFNLTDATQWVEVYGQFDFPALYEFIVDFFEDSSAGSAAMTRARGLLRWWDKQVFPNHIGASKSNAQRARKKLASQRFARQPSVPI